VIKKMMRRSCAVFLICCLAYTYLAVFSAPSAAEGLPDSFVYIEDVIPNIQMDLRYFTDKNFLGRRVDGYDKSRCILTKQAAEALRKVQEDLNRFGMGLKVFDAYRPQRAVDDFVRWGKDLNDTKMQTEYYPKVQKKDLFREGYIAGKSSHSKGSTVDLTIVCLDEQPSDSELDMGTRFDFFGPESWPDSPLVSSVHRAHRMLLQVLMQEHGFEPYSKEWWHFTLKNEPFPNTYFDFPVQ
jgi:zinc D-Ala-D-Ala dipeptidase